MQVVVSEDIGSKKNFSPASANREVILPEVNDVLALLFADQITKTLKLAGSCV